MVVILQTYKSFLKFFGSHHLGRKELLWRIVSIFHLVTLITYILAPINLEPDLKQFMNSVLSAAGGSLVYAIATHILINGVKFNSLVNELQDIVDESECNMQHFSKLDTNNNSIRFRRNSFERECRDVRKNRA